MPGAPKKKTARKKFIHARKYPRVQSEHVISIRPLTASGKMVTLTTSKIVGLGGIMFESSRSFRVGGKLELTLLAGTELLRLKVRVIWSRKSSGGPWQVGVEFLDITEDVQTKILDLLLRRIYLEEEARP